MQASVYYHNAATRLRLAFTADEMHFLSQDLSHPKIVVTGNLSEGLEVSASENKGASVRLINANTWETRIAGAQLGATPETVSSTTIPTKRKINSGKSVLQTARFPENFLPRELRLNGSAEDQRVEAVKKLYGVSTAEPKPPVEKSLKALVAEAEPVVAEPAPIVESVTIIEKPIHPKSSDLAINDLRAAIAMVNEAMEGCPEVVLVLTDNVLSARRKVVVLEEI